jgi:hypothetical protein
MLGGVVTVHGTPGRLGVGGAEIPRKREDLAARDSPGNLAAMTVITTPFGFPPPRRR